MLVLEVPGRGALALVIGADALRGEVERLALGVADAVACAASAAAADTSSSASVARGEGVEAAREVEHRRVTFAAHALDDRTHRPRELRVLGRVPGQQRGERAVEILVRARHRGGAPMSLMPRSPSTASARPATSADDVAASRFMDALFTTSREEISAMVS